MLHYVAVSLHAQVKLRRLFKCFVQRFHLLLHVLSMLLHAQLPIYVY